MAYDFSSFKNEVLQVYAWLEREYQGINTGRATPGLLDSVMIDVYGSRMQVAHVASIVVEDARTLKITPWDKSQIKDIERGLLASHLGITPNVDDTGIRLFFPQLTEERRKEYVKLIKEKLEDARISIRTEREKIIKDVDGKKKESDMSEDEAFKAKEDLQKLVEEANAKLEGIFEKKEKEVMGN